MKLEAEKVIDNFILHLLNCELIRERYNIDLNGEVENYCNWMKDNYGIDKSASLKLLKNKLEEWKGKIVYDLPYSVTKVVRLKNVTLFESVLRIELEEL